MTVATKEVFAIRLRDYASKVAHIWWDISQRALDELEVMIKQAKGKVDVEDDESLPFEEHQ
jgi:hypothetical protein